MHSTFPTSPDRAANVTPLRPNTSLAKAGLAGVSAAARAKPYDGYDVLTETLRQVRLTGSVFLNANFTKPFGVISPERFSAEAPMADLRHVSIFHLIASGSCEIEIASGERQTVSAGDIVLMPFAAAHKLWHGEVAEMPLAQELVRPGPIDGMWTIEHGGGGETTRMVCGFIESREFLYAPVFRSLPPLLIDRTGDDEASAVITATVRQILTLADAATPGSGLMLGRLMEMLFVEVVRRHAASLPPTSQNWFAACSDPIVGRALAAMHREAARGWTVAELAREAGTSRSVLSERFAALVGQPPIEYLASWRIQLAAERLRSTSDALASIGAEVGYESVAAFNRAFKRITGVTPGSWRLREVAA